jgi:beta-1,4-mannosyl-glycoprotein beta-1,4-N-acetylglucosaminyltransferase
LTVFDCFSFFNELDLLELRLRILDPIVDYFILSESNVTHSGKDKPLHYQLNRDRFSAYAHKIIAVDYTPTDAEREANNPWVLEQAQRNIIASILGELAQPDSIILSSDMDEIPNPKVLPTVIRSASQGTPNIFVLEQLMFEYFLNTISLDKPLWPMGTRLCRYERFKTTPLTLTSLRLSPGIYIPNGGWHFSCLGGVAKIIEKLEAYSHQEFNTNEYKDPHRLQERIQKGEDIFGRPNRYQAVPLWGGISRFWPGLPVAILNHQYHYQQLISPERPMNWIQFYQLCQNISTKRPANHKASMMVYQNCINAGYVVAPS